jgi:hypothetical protein
MPGIDVARRHRPLAERAPRIPPQLPKGPRSLTNPNVSGDNDVTDFDERLGIGIMYDEDSNMWSLVDAEGQQVGGPYVDKEAAQRALQRRAKYNIGKRKGADSKMKRQRSANPHWEKLEQLVDGDVGEKANPEKRAASMSEILKTPKGKELYAKGAGYYAPDTGDDDEDEIEPDDTEQDDDTDDDVEKREPIRKADAVWGRIKTQAETIQKNHPRGGFSFAKAVDQVLRDHPELYTDYRRALMRR